MRAPLCTRQLGVRGQHSELGSLIAALRAWPESAAALSAMEGHRELLRESTAEMRYGDQYSCSQTSQTRNGRAGGRMSAAGTRRASGRKAWLGTGTGWGEETTETNLSLGAVEEDWDRGRRAGLEGYRNRGTARARRGRRCKKAGESLADSRQEAWGGSSMPVRGIGPSV